LCYAPQVERLEDEWKFKSRVGVSGVGGVFMVMLLMCSQVVCAVCCFCTHSLCFIFRSLGYPDGGQTACNPEELAAAKAMGENVGPYKDQITVGDVKMPPVRVKSKTEGTIYVDHENTKHIIGYVAQP
jgi:hypothetical protein